jgi:hypothetical protein
MTNSIGRLALVLGLISVNALAAPTTYSFDTVTAVDLDHQNPKIVGIQKDSGANLTVSFVDNTNISFRYVVSRCVPVFLTAIEKPGRYYLHVTVDPADLNVQLRSCRLELKH